MVGYLVASFVVGALIERCKEKTMLNAFYALATGSAVIYLFGASYLATFVGLKQALYLGVVPFIVGDALKIVAALKILQWLRWGR